MDGAVGATAEAGVEEEVEEEEEDGVSTQKSNVTGEAILRLEVSCSSLLCESLELLELIEPPVEEFLRLCSLRLRPRPERLRLSMLRL